jgi:hypothetical protein
MSRTTYYRRKRGEEILWCSEAVTIIAAGRSAALGGVSRDGKFFQAKQVVVFGVDEGANFSAVSARLP